MADRPASVAVCGLSRPCGCCSGAGCAVLTPATEETLFHDTGLTPQFKRTHIQLYCEGHWPCCNHVCSMHSLFTDNTPEFCVAVSPSAAARALANVYCVALHTPILSSSLLSPLSPRDVRGRLGLAAETGLVLLRAVGDADALLVASCCGLCVLCRSED